jgi:hypothetical protein
MTADKDSRSRSLKRQLAWIAAHPGSARAWSASSRISALAMATTLGIGLIVHLVGYGVGTGYVPMPDWVPIDLASTLVSNLGIVLWTSVVLVVFLEVLPARTRSRATRSMALAAQALRDQGLPVPTELADLEEGSTHAAGSDADRTLEAVLERLTSIEQGLAAGIPVEGADRK